MRAIVLLSFLLLAACGDDPRKVQIAMASATEVQDVPTLYSFTGMLGCPPSDRETAVRTFLCKLIFMRQFYEPPAITRLIEEEDMGNQ